MTNHTAGPWTENACEVQAPDGTAICEMFARPDDNGLGYPYAPEADANSRLICAAPDLLAALEQTLATLDAICEMQGFDKYKQHGTKQARAAIAKAKGK